MTLRTERKDLTLSTVKIILNLVSNNEPVVNSLQLYLIETFNLAKSIYNDPINNTTYNSEAIKLAMLMRSSTSLFNLINSITIFEDLSNDIAQQLLKNLEK